MMHKMINHALDLLYFGSSWILGGCKQLDNVERQHVAVAGDVEEPQVHLVPEDAPRPEDRPAHLAAADLPPPLRDGAVKAGPAAVRRHVRGALRQPVHRPAFLPRRRRRPRHFPHRPPVRSPRRGAGERAQQLRDSLVEPRGRGARHGVRARDVGPLRRVAEAGEEVMVGEAELVEFGVDGHVPAERAGRVGASGVGVDGAEGIPEAAGAVRARGVCPAQHGAVDPVGALPGSAGGRVQPRGVADQVAAERPQVGYVRAVWLVCGIGAEAPVTGRRPRRRSGEEDENREHQEIW